jgi:hypothetical protein
MRATASKGFLVGLAVALFGAAGAQAATPFGLTCTVDTANDNVRKCEGTTATRVKSFDNTPIDVNVMLPATGESNLPLLTIMHGYGGDKQKATADETSPTAGDASQVGSMVRYAKRGYAVLSFAARGFKESCGTASSRLQAVSIGQDAFAACQKGWIHLDDMRFEARDAQWLMGKLVDQGLVDPQRLGVAGVSYGGITSTQLAALKDRMWTFPAGGDPATATLVPFTSPGGVAMRIAAARPAIPGSDLAYSLVPNGHTTDFQIIDRKDDITPVGVPKQSFIAGLFGTGQSGMGYYAPPGVDQNADITNWFARVNAGDPYEEDVAKGIVEQISRWRSGYALLSNDTPSVEPPAPTLFGNGFTDDLFPVDEAVRFYNRARFLFPGTPISMFFASYGHQRGQNKAPDKAMLRDAYTAWFDHYLKGDGPLPFQGVTALTQTCPNDAASEGPFSAGSWEGLHPGEVRQLFTPAVTFGSTGGDPNVSRSVDPVASGQGDGACSKTDSADQPEQAAATYRMPKVDGSYLLMGAPTVIAKITAEDPSGAAAQIAARLWDVPADGGQQTLVARALYRPEGKGNFEVFQLHANGYRFADGHTAKLELLGADTPYGRQSNGAFTITVSDLELRLPVMDAADCKQVFSHRAPFAAGRPLAPDVAPGGTGPCGEPATGQSVQYSAGKGGDHGSVNGQRVGASGRPLSSTTSGSANGTSGSPGATGHHRIVLRSQCRRGRNRVLVGGRNKRSVRRVSFYLGKRRLGRDRRAPFQAKVPRRAGHRRVRAVAVFRDGAKRTVHARARRCRR